MNDKKLMIKSKGILNQIGLLGVIAVLCIIFTCLNSTFIAAANLMNIVRQSAVMIIVAMGVTFVMISGELDLSIGGVACLTGMVVSKLLTTGVSIPVAILIGLLLGALLGLFNGILTTKFNLPSMIVTLATMNLANGSASLITGGTAIYNLPQEFEFLGRGFIFGIPAQVVFMVILVIICGIVLSKTLIGRYALAIGGNADVAKLAGISVVFCILQLMRKLCRNDPDQPAGNRSAESGVKYDDGYVNCSCAWRNCNVRRRGKYCRKRYGSTSSYHYFQWSYHKWC